MKKKEIIYNTFIDLFQWMDASDVEDLDTLLNDNVALWLKFKKQRPTKENVRNAIKTILFRKINLGIAEEKCPTDAFLSIQSSLIRDSWIYTTTLLRFVMKWKKKGYFDPICTDFYMREIRHAKNKKDSERLLQLKTILVERIMRQCLISKEIRIDLQQTFGQFDGAQVCENCGNLMWDGYSWFGTTFCCEECVMEGDHIDRKTMNEYLKDAEDPDGSCYYTEWY